MAESDDYVFCNNDLEVHAGDRTSYKTANWWTDKLSGGMCNWSVCGSGDVYEWFAAATKYIKSKFTPHFERYQSNINMSQGAASIEQQQILAEAKALLSEWANYSKYFRSGGGGPVGASFRTGGYVWGTPSGPGLPLLMDGNPALALAHEIVDFYDSAACLRDKFNETKPDGMLSEAPGYGGVTQRPPAEEASSGLSTVEIGMMGLGAWILLKALSD